MTSIPDFPADGKPPAGSRGRRRVTPRHDHEVLARGIVARSDSADWETAREEWLLADVYQAPDDEPAVCLCGHRPIVQVCVLMNVVTGKTAAVGRVCVRQFLHLPAADAAVLKGFDRVTRNRSAALTPEAVEFAAARGLLDGWEVGFARNTCRLKRLKAGQKSMWTKINTRVLAARKGGAS